MFRTLAILAFGFALFPIIANSQNLLTGKEIYRINRNDIAEIYVGGKFSGNGFFVGSGGIVLTANHVVTTPKSKLREYTNGITVSVCGQTDRYEAAPVPRVVSDDQVNFDSAVLKVSGLRTPHTSHVTFGVWKSVEVGDAVTVISCWPGMGPFLLQGIVSNQAEMVTFFGPKTARVTIFQLPIRKGFSGSPVFDSRGRVFGIEDTLVFGVTPALDALRSKWSQEPYDIVFGGVDMPKSFTEIISNLEENLISGLGSSMDVQYAKEQSERNK